MFNIKLRKLRTDRGLTQESLASALGIAKSTVSMYENGNREPDFETLEAIADFFNVNMSYLVDRNIKDKFDVFSAPGISPIKEMKKVPRLGTIACGEPITAEQNIEGYDLIEADIRCDFTLVCKGDSMINAHIFDGDIVYIRQQSDVDEGEIAAVLIDNEATLKKVYKYTNKLVLRPCNPLYEDLVYTDREMANIRILGKAICYKSFIQH